MHQPALRQKFQEAPARAALNQMIKQGEGKPGGRLSHGAETLREIGISRATLRGAALSCAQKIVA
jgi:DNA-binding FadR family transcriptional regulator